MNTISCILKTKSHISFFTIFKVQTPNRYLFALIFSVLQGNSPLQYFQYRQVLTILYI